jgi:hypothetical protein
MNSVLENEVGVSQIAKKKAKLHVNRQGAN